MAEIDPFGIFRTTLFVALVVYTLVTMGATAWYTIALLAGRDPRKRLLRVYVSYQLLSFRARPLAGELVQLVLWTGVLVAIWWLHRALA